MILKSKPESEWVAKDHEKVLCVSRSFLENALGRFSGFYRSLGFTNVLQRYSNKDTDVWDYIPRGICETDPSWKQLIPYLVLFAPGQETKSKDASVLTYWRSKAAAEERLHGKRSCGFGGHISDKDGVNLYEAFVAGCKREISEEVGVGDHTVRLLGLLNDDSTPVGSVHLGVVLAVELEDNTAVASDAELGDLSFHPTSELFTFYNKDVHDDFEDWSKILLTSNTIVRDDSVAEGPVLWRSKCSEK